MTTSATPAADLSGGDHVFIGGTVGFDQLGTGSLAASLTASGVALYMHANAMQGAYDAGQLPAIAAAYADAGPGEAEFGFQSGANLTSYFQGYFANVYLGQGVAPNEANIVLPVEASSAPAILTAADLASWETYVDTARAWGVLSVAPIISPNAGTEDISSWNDPYWQPAQAAAEYGGGLTVDAPPAYFLGRGSDYQAFTEQQIAWANAQGLRSTAIISPYGDTGSLLADTEAFVAKLAAAGTMPSQFVVENYSTGGSDDTAELAQVAIWLAQNTPSAASASPVPASSEAAVAAAARAAYAAGSSTISVAAASSVASATSASSVVAATPSSSVAAATPTSSIASATPTSSIASATSALAGAGTAMSATVQAGAATSGWIITAAAGTTTVTLGSGAETVSSQGNDTILAGSGTTLVYASGPAVSVAGGAGALVFVGGTGAATVSGGAGAVTLFGGAGGGTLAAGQAGGSILVAGGANTTLQGAAAGDVLFGASTANGSVLRAGSGPEILVAGAGATTLAGGSGTSVQFAGTGADLFGVGGGGTDEIVGFAAGDSLASTSAVATAVQHGAWGTTLSLSDGTTVVLFGVTTAPAV